jgi:hypothetical protein
MTKQRDSGNKPKRKRTGKNKPVATHDEIQVSRKTRRHIVISTLLFCAGLISYITFKGATPEMGENRLYETIIIASFSLSGSVIGFYIAGQTWDITKNAARGKQ